jgi:hypothetical protein
MKSNEACKYSNEPPNVQLQISDKIVEIEVVQLSQLVHPLPQDGTYTYIIDQYDYSV